MRKFLVNIGLTLSESKTKVTNINLSRFLFLGTEILRAKEYWYTKVSSGTNKGTTRRVAKGLRMQAPIQRVLDKLTKSGFMKEGKSYPKFVWMTLEHRQILHLYNSVLRGFLNYYSFVHNFGQFASRLYWELKSSCMKLLAAKYSLQRVSKVLSKFGKDLTCKHVGPDGKTKEYKFMRISYMASLRFLVSASPNVASLYGSKSLANLDGPCLY